MQACQAGAPALPLLAVLPPVLPILLAITVAFGATGAEAANFTISGNSTSSQTLSAGQTGKIATDASLTVSGSTVAVTVSGNNATFTNLGTLSQTGTGRAIRDNTGVTGLVITNGSATDSFASMVTADADVIQMNKATGGVTLYNYGSMISNNASAGGNQVVDFSAVTKSANALYNTSTGSILAKEADAVRPGVNGVVNNSGSITSVTTSGGSSDAVDMQSNSGLALWNAGTISGGRHGITGEQSSASTSFAASITNVAGAVIQGNNGSGVNFDGFSSKQLVTISNAGSITGNGVSGDGDGVDVDGLVAITNTGVIRSLNSFSAVASGVALSEAISAGGGSIINSGIIEGLVASGNTNAVGRGISLVGNDISSGINAGKREALYGDASIVNQSGGLIRGVSDSAIYAGGLTGSGYQVGVGNAAGATIRGGGTTAAILVASDYKTTIVNAGLIDGSSSGKAIQLGSGDNRVRIEGAQASVHGSIDGGSGSNNRLELAPGNGNAFSYNGSLANFSQVVVESGTTRLSGVSTYSGLTTVSDGAVLVLDGANRLSSTSSLLLAGGGLSLENAAGTSGQTLSSLSLSGSSQIQLNGSALSFLSLGTVASGSLLTITGAGNLGYALRFLGDYSGQAAFQTLLSATTIDGAAARFSYDGNYTNVAAVPEPETYAMFLAGLGLLGVAGRRSRKA